VLHCRLDLPLGFRAIFCRESGAVGGVSVGRDDAADVNTPLAAVWDQHDLVADTTALKAILVPTHGLIRYVRGYGHYVFVTSGTYSASTAASPWILTATDGTPGRWVMDLTANAISTVARFVSCPASLRYTETSVSPKSETIANFFFPTATQIQTFNKEIRYASADNTIASGLHTIYDLDPYLINGATLVSAELYLKGQGHGALPAMMPAMSIMRYDVSANTLVGLRAAGMTDDTSPDVATYEAIHFLTVTCDQNNVLVTGTKYNYYAIVCNEGHTNAQAELALRGIKLTMTAAGYR
jgi:hypothetical protein